MGLFKKLGRKTGKTEMAISRLQELEAEIREKLDVREAPDNMVDAMRELARQRHIGRVKRQKYFDRKARGPKQRVRTLERYRDRAVLGRATADNFAAVVGGMEGASEADL